MTPDPADVALGYHQRTKHHPGRYARSLGYLDWATQPDPFRRFQGAPLVRLPVPAPCDHPAYDAIFEPGAVEPRPLDVESVSMFFYLSLALSAWKQAGDSRWALRCNPSSGNLHPTEGYAVLPALEGIGDKPGVYHYVPREHALERRAACSAETLTPLCSGGAEDPSSPRTWCFLTGLTSIHWREAWKYGERAFRYCQHDVGHALGALRFAAAVLGWRLVVLEELGDVEVARMLGVDRAEDFAGAEPEHPDLIAAVFPADASDFSIAEVGSSHLLQLADAAWTGRANLLSSDHVQWNIIDAVNEATHKPRTCESATPSNAILSIPGDASAHRADRRPISAFQVIRTRRSAVAFDGTTGLSADAFYHMLGRVMPGADRARRMPWDSVTWPARVHLFLFVHMVEGLEPGLYALPRDPAQLGTLQEACNPEFPWSVPKNRPSGLPLFKLIEADTRRAAAQLSLGQEIAGTSALSLGMVGDLAPLRTQGAWRYRQLFWEAGLIGQVLYLEARAAGLQATGIGAYFDDLVHETLGLRDHRFASLYHFTLGGPVDDPRVLSMPAYPAP